MGKRTAVRDDPTYRLIDVNCRLFSVGPDFVDFLYLDDLCSEKVDPQLPRRGGERDGSALFALCPPTYYSLSKGIEDNRRLNNRLQQLASGSGDRFFAVAEPKYGQYAREEIQRMASCGAAGIVWSPRAQGVFANDRHMADLCNFVGSLGMISMIQSAPYSINESLIRVWHLATQCPDTNLIILGALASWENIQAIQQEGLSPGNVFYDVSGVSTERDIEAAVATLGSGRLLFGSGGARFFDTTLAIIQRCSLDDSAKRAILTGNAASLLKL